MQSVTRNSRPASLVCLLTEFLHALLAGDGLARALAGAGVGAGALAADGQAAAVTVAAVAADVAQPARCSAGSGGAARLRPGSPVDDADDLGQLFFGQFLGAALGVDAGFLEDLRLLVGPTP